MTDDYLWKIRCPESGYLIGECSCTYCYDEFELDEYLDDVTDVDEDWWFTDEVPLEDLSEFDIEDDLEVEEII